MNRRTTRATNNGGNPFEPQYQQDDDPNPVFMATPQRQEIRGRAPTSEPSNRARVLVRRADQSQNIDVTQLQQRRGGNFQSQVLNTTQFQEQRQQVDNTSSEIEQDDNREHSQDLERDEEYKGNNQRGNNQDQLAQDQIKLLRDELLYLRLENQKLAVKNNEQEAELNSYADEQFVAQAQRLQGGDRNQNNSRSGGPPRFDGVDPQSSEDSSINAYDISDANTWYYLTPLSSKDLGTPWKSLELHIKGRISQKSILSSDINSFEPWKTYFTSILNSAWLTCLAKINIYKVPRRDEWTKWDDQCIKGRSPNVSRVTYHSIMQQVDKQVPVISYKDGDGIERTFSTSTHVDVMNTAILAVSAKHGGQLMFSLCNILSNSIDPKSLRSVLNLERVADITNLRETFFAAVRYHENNSDTIISYKMNKFTSTTDYKMVQSESPLGYLKRLQEEAVYINSMAPTGEASPITDRMLRNKFLSGVKQIDYLRPVTVTYDLGYVDNRGEPQQYPIERYASLLEKIYAEKKDKAATSSRDFHHHSGPRGFSLQDEDVDGEGLEFGMSLREGKEDKSPPVCFAFRDTGICKFGRTCKYPHVKASSQPKSQHKANSAQLLEQHMVNVEHEHALKLEEYKKKIGKSYQRKLHHYRKKDKMKPYKRKLDEQNSRFATKDKANLAEEEKQEDQVAAAAKELEEEVQEDSDTGGSDLSGLESESEDQ